MVGNVKMTYVDISTVSIKRVKQSQYITTVTMVIINMGPHAIYERSTIAWMSFNMNWKIVM